MILIDTHTHLFSEKFDEDRTEMVERALAARVDKLFLPNVDISTIDKMNELEKQYPNNCFSMLGLHPCHVDEKYLAALAIIDQELNNRSYAGIGETGLDYYWDTTFKKEQQNSLHQHAEWAKKHNLPIILHTRDSFDDSLAIMQEHNSVELTGVFHCFSGTQKEAEKVAALEGFFIGIGGVVTFKKSHLPEVLANVPLELIVLETDSPYLAPSPNRGKRNESSYLPLVAQKIAEIKNISMEEVAAITSENAKKLYASTFKKNLNQS